LLDDSIFVQLAFYYKTKVGRNGNDKVVRLFDEDKIIENNIRTENNPGILARVLALADVEVQVRHKIGENVEEDCSCNSDYMITAMD